MAAGASLGAGVDVGVDVGVVDDAAVGDEAGAASSDESTHPVNASAAIAKSTVAVRVRRDAFPVIRFP
jgi:hypothetical protein